MVRRGCPICCSTACKEANWSSTAEATPIATAAAAAVAAARGPNLRINCSFRRVARRPTSRRARSPLVLGHLAQVRTGGEVVTVGVDDHGPDRRVEALEEPLDAQ